MIGMHHCPAWHCSLPEHDGFEERPISAPSTITWMITIRTLPPTSWAPKRRSAGLLLEL